MSQKRFDQQENHERNGTGAALAVAEAARSAAQAPTQHREKSDDERVSLFWRVFGGTILSMVALGAITLYNSISSNISELRAELNREREARSELIKKDEFNTRTSTQYERIRAFDGLKAEHEGLKERVAAHASVLDGLRREASAGADAVKKDVAALEVVKERVASLEALRKEVAGLEVLRERVATSGGDLKVLRDDVAKIQQELERNRAFDLERKANRDSQYKQTEEALKELQKGLQDCREKLARLEGMQPAGVLPRGLLPASQPRPSAPAEAKGAGGAGAGDGKPGGQGATGNGKPGPDGGD